MKTSKIVNLVQLDQELNGQGLNATVDENGKITEVFLTAENTATEDELAEALKNHKAIFNEITLEEKLASVGVSLKELKAAILE